MADRIKNIPNQLLEFWNKYTNKQKAMIVSVVAVVLLSLGILTYVVSRPQWEELGTYSSTKEASTVKTLLTDNGIPYKLSKDGLLVWVESKNISEAFLLLGSNDLPSTGLMSKDDLFTSSMSTTESDKKTKLRLYQEDVLRAALMKIEGVSDAVVQLTMPDQGSTVLDEAKEPYAAVNITTNSSFKESSVLPMANYIAASMGTKSLANVRIIDQSGKLLYSGAGDLSSSNSIGSSLEFKEQIKNSVANDVINLLLTTRMCDNAYVVPNLVFDMDITEEVYKEYSAPAGREEGMKANEYLYNNSNSSGTGGIPGTDSNGETTDYMTAESSGASGETSISKTVYTPNEKITNKIKDRGAIIFDDSKIAVTLQKYNIVTEESLEKSGALNDISYEEYKLANSSSVASEVDAQTINLIASATNLKAENITATLYTITVFQDKEVTPIAWSSYLNIAIAVIILGLLLFVVLRGTAPVEVTELEPELSVEQLLATTKENQSLDDIEFSEKSETRKLIEKFVDENPEAVAHLLRNWLNEEWEG